VGTFETNPTRIRITAKPHRKRLVIDLTTELNTHACTMTVQSKSTPVTDQPREQRKQRRKTCS